MATRQNTGKRSKILHTIYNDWKTNVEKNQCDFVHTRKGELEIRPSEKKRDGLLLYVCRLCEKDLCLNEIEESDLEQAIAIIDRAIDTIKMHLDLDKAKDAAIAERMAECQFRIRNQVKKAYMATLSNARKGKGNGRNEDKDSAWAKPVVNNRY